MWVAGCKQGLVNLRLYSLDKTPLRLKAVFNSVVISN